MGSILKFRYMRMDLTMNSSDDDKIKDHMVVPNEINNLNLNDDEECSSDKELGKSWQPGTHKVPKKPRTPRVFLGLLTSKPGEDAYQFRSADQVIIDYACRFRSADQVIIDDAYQLQSADQVIIIDEKNSRKSGKRPLDKDYIVSDDFNEEEDSSSKKRQKKIEKKTTVPRKPVQLYNIPLPQNFQDYISGLNLEVPPLFVAQKLLTWTDINPNEGRLLLPKSLINAQFFNKFLTENEKELVEKRQPVEVNLVDDMMREYTLHMTQWAMNSSLPIALKKAWKTVVAENKLKKVLNDEKENTVGMEDDNKLLTDVVARLWSFRRESNIWFALNLQAMAELKY